MSASNKPSRPCEVRHFIFQAPGGADPLQVNRLARAAVVEWAKAFGLDHDTVTWFEDDGGSIRFHLIIAHDPASSTTEMPQPPAPTDEKGGVA